MNNFPISVSQIAEGMNNASSALSAAGNSLDESIALLAAANVTVQNASKASTAVRTITARLRNSKADLDELGEEVMTTAKYQQLLNTLTENNVQIVDKVTGKYNSTYKIMSQLARVWDGLNDGIKATLTTQLAGVRNVDVFNSILSNFKDTAEGAMNAMADSAGALSSAYDVYLSTAAAHINSLKAAWQEFAQGAVKSDFVIGMIDAVKSVVEMLSGVVSTGAFDILPETISLIVKLATSIIHLADTIGVLNPMIFALVTSAAFKTLPVLLDGLNLRLLNIAKTATHLLSKRVFYTLASYVGSFGKALAGIAGPAALVVGSVTAIISIIRKIPTAYDIATKNLEKYSKAAEESTQKVNELTGELKDNAERIEELGRKLKNGTISGEEFAELSALEKLNEELRINIELRKQEQREAQAAADAALEAQFNAINKEKYRYDRVGTDYWQDYFMYTENGLDVPDAIEHQIESGTAVSSGLLTYEESLEYAVKRYSELLGYINDGIKLSQDQKDQFEELTKFIRDEYLFIDEKMNALNDKKSPFGKELAGYLNTLKPAVDLIVTESTELKKVDSGVQRYTKSLSDLKDTLESAKDAYDVIAKAEKEMSNGQGISYDTLKALMKATDDYSKYLYEENGQLMVNLSLLKQQAGITYKNDITSVKKEIDDLESNIERIKSLDEYKFPNLAPEGVFESMQDEIDTIGLQIKEDEELLKFLEAAYNTVIKSSTESSFAKMYKEHQHLLAMDRESAEDYIDWLRSASKTAYDEGWISLEELEKYEEEVHKGMPKLSDSISNLSKAYDTLTSSRKEYEDTGKLSVGTIESIISSTDKYADILEVENGEIKLNEEAWINYFKSKYELARADAENERTLLAARRSRLKEEQSGYINNEKVYAEYEQQITDLDEEIDEAGDKIAIFDAQLSNVGKRSNADVWGDISGRLDGISKTYSAISSARNEMIESGRLSLDTVESILSISPEYVKFLSVEGGLVKLNADALREYAESKATAKIGEINEEIAKLRESGDEEGVENLIRMREAYEAFLKTYKPTITLSDAVSELSKCFDVLHSAQDEMSRDGKLSVSTIESIISATENYVDVLEIENGEIKLNEEAWKQLYRNRYELAKEDVESQRQRLIKEREDINGGMYALLRDGDTEALDAAIARLEEIGEEIADLEAQGNLFDIMMDRAGERELSEVMDGLSESISNVTETYSALHDAQLEMSSAGKLSFETFERLLSISSDYIKFLSVENGQVKLNAEALRDYADAQARSRIAEINKEIEQETEDRRKNRTDKNYDLVAANDERIQDLIRMRDAYESFLDTAKRTIELSDAISELKGGFDTLRTAQNEMREDGKLSIETIESIISSTENYVDVLEIENGEIKLNEEAWEELHQNKYSAAKAELETQQSLLQAERASLVASLALYSNDAEMLRNLTDALKVVDEELKRVQGELLIGDVLEDMADDISDEELWSGLSEALSDTTKTYDAIKSAQDEMSKSGKLSYETVESLLSINTDYAKFLQIENGQIKLNTQALKEYAEAQAQTKLVDIDNQISELQEKMRNAWSDGDFDLANKFKGEIDGLQALKDVYSVLSSEAGEVHNLSDAISELSSNHDILATAQKEMTENGKLSVGTIQAIMDATDNYLDYLVEENGEIKLNEQAWKDYYTNRYEAARDEAQKMLDLKKKQYGAKVSELDLFYNNPTEYNKIVEELRTLEAEIKQYEGDVSFFDNIIDKVLHSAEAVKDYMDTVVGKMKDSLSDLSGTYDAIAKAQEEMNGAYGLSRETVENLLSINSEYVQFLTAENGIIRLNTEALKEYAEAQYATKIGEVSARLTELKNQLNDAEIGSEEYKMLQNQITMLENEIGVYQTLLDSISSGAESIGRTTSYISDMRDSLKELASVQEIVSNGFVVAADKVKDLAAAFPELFANATAYADGSIKLDNEVANNFLTNRQAEVDASIDAKILDLQAQLEVVKAKKEFVDAEIELAQTAAQSESSIDKAVAQYKIENADAVAQTLIDAGVAGAEAYAIAAKSMYDNSFNLDTAIAEATNDIATNYSEAFASAADASAANALAINTNVDSTTRQVHQAAAAMAGMPGGKIQGAEGVIKPGASGSRVPSHTASIGMYTDSGTGNVQAMMQGVIQALQQSHISIQPAEFAATYFSSQFSAQSLSDLILDKIPESQALGLLQQQLEGQIAILQSLKKIDLSKFRDKEKTGSSSAGSGGKPSTSSTSSGTEENPFAKMYAEHQHLLAMEQEEVGDYFAWLDKASKEAYEKGWITIEDLRKYEEEVYRGLKEIISDAESAMRDLVEFRQKMLEKEYEDQKQVLQTQLDLVKKFYDEQKEALQKQREEEEYEKEKAEKQKAVSDIEAEIEMLSHDNSAKAQKRLKELMQALAEAQSDYTEFEQDHAYQLAEDALDAAYEQQTAELQAQIAAIDQILNDPTALFNQALDDIKNDTGELYDAMVQFAIDNGEGESTIQQLWNNAFVALQDLHTVTSEDIGPIATMLENLPSDIASLITGFSLQNSTGYTTGQSSSGSSSSSSSSSSSGSSSGGGGGGSSTIPVGTAVKASGMAYSTVKGTGNAVDVSGKQLYVAQVWDNAANPYWQGDYTYGVSYTKGGPIVGWVRKDQLSGYAKGTAYATAGMHRVDEKGHEALFISSSGDHYRLLSSGDKVFNAEATDFLYKFANGDKDIFKDLFASVFSKSALNSIANRQSIGDVRMGDIIINGNADKATVSEIRRAQRESVDSLLQQFGRLQRAAR